MSDSPRDRRNTDEQAARWSAARARNALRRRRLAFTVGACTALSAFFLLHVLPREADRALRARVAALPPVFDTVVLHEQLARARDHAQTQTEAIEALQARRRQDSVFAVSVHDAAGVPRLIVGDTLRADLAGRLQLARSTRLVEGYLALADAPALAADTLARVLADSLRDAEQEREAFAVLGGPDQRYRTLRERVTELGERLDARAVWYLRDSDTLDARAASASDSVELDRQRAFRQAADSVIALETALQQAVAWNALRAERERALRAAEPLRVPAGPMILAVLSLAAAAGYLAAFLVEWRQPRLADTAEVIALVRGARFDATVVAELGAATTEPRRRASDRLVPSALHGDMAVYHRIHLALSAMGDVVPVVGVMSDDAERAAGAALNLAAAAAEGSRAALLVDADVSARRVGPIAGQDGTAGLADVTRGRLELAAALTTVMTGRDRSIALLGAGSTRSSRAALEAITPDLHRLMQRHDLAVLVLPQDANGWPTALVPRDLVFAVTPGSTDVAWLRGALHAAAREGQRVRSVLVVPEA